MYAINLSRRALTEGTPARRRRGNERGSSLVELGVSLPLLLLILTGMFTFGIALNNYLMLTDAVSIGGRALAISRGQTTNPCADTAKVVAGVAPLLSSAALKYTLVLNAHTEVSAVTTPSCSSSSTTTGAAGDLVQGSTAQLTVTYPCKLAVFGVNYIPSCNLSSQTTEVVQ